MDNPWIICGSSDMQCGSHPSNLEIQCIHGLSMDHPTSNVVAIPVIRKYNVSMDYPWIIHGSSNIQCGNHPSNSEIQCIHALSMDHPTSNVVATPVIRKYNVSMHYPWSSDIQCGSHPSNSEIQCIDGLPVDYPWIIRHSMW